jgi:hypothetical protein
MIEYKLAQIQALFDVANKTDLYFFRKVCRWYSNQFHTPLHITETLPYPELLQHYYEYHFEQLPPNDLLNAIIDYIPELAQAKEDEFLKWEQELIEENKRQSLNKSPQTPKPEEPKNQDLPEVFTKFDLGDDEL